MWHSDSQSMISLSSSCCTSPGSVCVSKETLIYSCTWILFSAPEFKPNSSRPPYQQHSLKFTLENLHGLAIHLIWWMRQSFSVFTIMVSDLGFNSCCFAFFLPCPSKPKIWWLGVRFVFCLEIQPPSYTLFSEISTSELHMVTNNISIYTKSRWSLCQKPGSQQQTREPMIWSHCAADTRLLPRLRCGFNWACDRGPGKLFVPRFTFLKSWHFDFWHEGISSLLS